MTEDARILDEYRLAFRRLASSGVIDMDQHLRHHFNFQIHRLEAMVSALDGEIPLSRQSQFFLNFITRGSGEKTIGKANIPIRRNILFMIPRRMIHGSTYWSANSTGYILGFNLEFFLSNAFPTHLIATQQGHDAPDTDHCDFIDRFDDLLRLHHSRERTVAFYARSLHMHPNHLNATVKKYTGLTAKATIMGYLLSEARHLLSSTSLTIKEIAHQLGFDDPDQFSALFRRHFHVSPRQFKRSTSNT